MKTPAKAKNEPEWIRIVINARPFVVRKSLEKEEIVKLLASQIVLADEELESVKRELETVKRERDAAVRDIPRACGYCKHYAHRKTHECHSKKPCANISGVNTAWEWHGLCESNGGAEDALQ